jgi:hypothetical protein
MDLPEERLSDHSRGSEVTTPNLKASCSHQRRGAFEQFGIVSSKKTNKFTNLPGTGTSKSWI